MRNGPHYGTWHVFEIVDHATGTHATMALVVLCKWVAQPERGTYEGCNFRGLLVSYGVDPETGQGYVYLPGRSDPPYRLNTNAIYGGREGNWFRANAAWQSAFRSVVQR